MTLRYCRSGATGTGSGADWTNAFTTLSAALTASAAGDTIWISEDHAENVAGTSTFASPGTAASPVKIICVNHAVASGFVSGDLRQSAQCKTTANNVMAFTGFAQVYGVIFRAGASTGGPSISFVAAASGWVLENCELGFGGTGGTPNIKFGSNSQGNTTIAKHTLRGTSFRFTNTAQTIQLGAVILEICGSTDGASTDLFVNSVSIPTNLFSEAGTPLGPAIVHMHDVYADVAGICAAFTRPHRLLLERCRLNSSYSVTTPTNPSAQIDLAYCDTVGSNNISSRTTYQGTVTTETTVVPTPGPVDTEGKFSRLMASSANASRYFPLEGYSMGEVYVSKTGVSISQTIEVITDNVVLTNADFWVEVNYFDTNYPEGHTVTSGLADPLATAVNLTTSAASWGGSLGTPKPQKITISWTPQARGLYRIVPKLAKASTNVYVAPLFQKAS